MHLFRSVSIALTAFAVLSCAPSDEERCSENQRYDEGSCVCEEGYKLDNESLECVPVEIDQATGEDDQNDSGSSGGEVDLSGLGDYCTIGEGDCEHNPVASFCAGDPTTKEGKCTVVDCTVVPDDCPEGWICCDFDGIGDMAFGGRNLCLDDEMLDGIAKYQVECL